VRAESRNKGTANIQLRIFELPYRTYSMPKFKSTKTKPQKNQNPNQKPKSQEVFAFYDFKKTQTKPQKNAHPPGQPSIPLISSFWL